MKETKVEARLNQKVNALRGRCEKWPAGGGVPDRIVFIPYGKVYIVELKKPGGKRRPLQEEWGEWLEANGFEYRLLDSYEAVDRFIEEVSA